MKMAFWLKRLGSGILTFELTLSFSYSVHACPGSILRKKIRKGEGGRGTENGAILKQSF